MELAGNKSWSPPLNQGLHWDPKEVTYEKLINYNANVAMNQNLSDEEIENEVKGMTGNCSTCDDHLQDYLSSKEVDEKNHILQEGRDAEIKFKRKHF